MRFYRFLASLFLIAALAAPLAMWASPQDRDDHHDNDNRNRVYDRSHHDYHQWNNTEASNYQRWEQENHRDHRDYNKLRSRDQNKYWSWRHSQSDNGDRHDDHHDDKH